jgi:cell division inhibitor SepF
MPSWIKNLIHPFDEEDEDFGGNYSPPTPPQEAPPAQRTTAAPQRAAYSGFSGDPADKNSKVAYIHTTAQLAVVLAKPDKFEKASEIAEHLRERKTVVLNLEKTSKEQARRLLDFLAGVAFAQDGKVKPVAVNTYLITPYNVDLLGDIADELENSGLYF